MYEGDEINSGDGGSFDRPGAIVSSSPDEQQNVKPVKVKEPAPVSPQSPYVPEQTPRTRNKMPLFIGIGAVALVAIVITVVVVLINSGNKIDLGNPAVAGEPNLAGLFDKTAPIPYRGSKISQYGYIDPNTGEWVIDSQYAEADPFYGEYARVRKNEEDMIINRKGEIVQKSGQKRIKYDIEENVWTIGRNVFNGEMKKANPEGSMATYLGDGYAFVVPENEDEESTWMNGIPYIVKVENTEKIYECKNLVCSATIGYGRTDGNIYAIVVESDHKDRSIKNNDIIDLSNGKKIYSAPVTNTLAKKSDGIFVERTKETKKIVNYIIVDNGEAKKQSSLPTENALRSISYSNKYYKKDCGSKNGFKITDDADNEILPCTRQPYWELSKNVYKRLEKEGKEVILFYDNGNLHVYDLKSNKDLKVYENVGAAIPYENSVFINISLGNNNHKICNILALDKDCVEVGEETVIAYPTYFIAGDRTYSYYLKEVRYETAKE